MLELASNSKELSPQIISSIYRIKDSQRCGLIYYILTDFLHLRDVSPLNRRCLANIVAYLVEQKSLSNQHIKLAYEHFSELASDLIVDIPELWLYIFQFMGPLIVKKVINIKDLWNSTLKSADMDGSSFAKKFLKTMLLYCTQEIGPQFTRNMWKENQLKWTDYIPDSEVDAFVKSNKFEYIDDETIAPYLEIRNENKEKHIARVIDQIKQLLSEGSTADSLIDFINGNIVDINKHFIKNLTTALCNFAISYEDNSYKLQSPTFQKICIPVLQRCIDDEFKELECLFAMQLLVHSLEHPRGLLSDLFAELYDGDVIPQESFIKWRDSKDQSAGKGVAVKGLNPFFNQVLIGETSDENN